jgi:hypothetical protein
MPQACLPGGLHHGLGLLRAVAGLHVEDAVDPLERGCQGAGMVQVANRPVDAGGQAVSAFRVADQRAGLVSEALFPPVISVIFSAGMSGLLSLHVVDVGGDHVRDVLQGL